MRSRGTGLDPSLFMTRFDMALDAAAQVDTVTLVHTLRDLVAGAGSLPTMFTLSALLRRSGHDPACDAHPVTLLRAAEPDEDGAPPWIGLYEMLCAASTAGDYANIRACWSTVAALSRPNDRTAVTASVVAYTRQALDCRRVPPLDRRLTTWFGSQNVNVHTLAAVDRLVDLGTASRRSVPVELPRTPDDLLTMHLVALLPLARLYPDDVDPAAAIGTESTGLIPYEQWSDERLDVGRAPVELCAALGLRAVRSMAREDGMWSRLRADLAAAGGAGLDQIAAATVTAVSMTVAAVENGGPMVWPG